MKEIIKLKHRIWLYVAGLILVPYPLLLLSGVLSDRYPQMYFHAEVILSVFVLLIVLFLILIGRTVLKYRNVKNQLSESSKH